MKTLPSLALLIVLSGLAFPIDAHSQSIARQLVSRRPLQPVSRSLSLNGSVLTADGRPASNAVIYLSWVGHDGPVKQSAATIRTDGAGRFRKSVVLSGAAKSCRVGVTAFDEGKGYDTAVSTLGSKSLSHLALRLKPLASLQGRLLRASGDPASNVEIGAEALISIAGPGTGNEEQMVRTISARAATFAPRFMQYDYMMRALPDGVAQKLYHTKTDVAGRFTLRGLPPGSAALLRTAGGLTLTPASMTPLRIGSSGAADIGTLVVTRCGEVTVRILDAATHRPAVNSIAMITRRAPLFAPMLLYHSNPPFTLPGSVCNNETGIVVFKDLLPGPYRVSVAGKSQDINVGEGATSSRLEFSLRQGPLVGRVVDPSGKPVANVPIMMNVGSSRGETQFDDGSRVFDGVIFEDRRRSAFDGFWEKNGRAVTGSDGTFRIEDMPWGADHMIVRATKGNDRAQFEGAISTIGSELVLQMRPHALVSVTGRLVDTRRRPIAGAVCQALHWQPTPRATWFASAHEVRTDAKGRFRIDGLERGESFSVISNGQRFQIQQAVSTRSAGVKTVALANSPITNFESPRFAVARETATQDLGDMMVHPSNAPEEVLQSYGVVQREIVSSGVIEAPGADAVLQAQAAFRQYLQAVSKGDARAIHDHTSRLSVDYAADLHDFLLRASLLNPQSAAADSTAPIRFAPRSFIKSLVSANDAMGGFPQFARNNDLNGLVVSDLSGMPGTAAGQFATASSELHSDGKWLLLRSNAGGRAVFAGALHLEDGQWRVISSGPPAGTPLAALAGFFAGADPRPGAITTPAPKIPIDQFASAAETGSAFLRNWAENHPQATRRLTSTSSFSFATSLDEYKTLQERRTDQGNCPLNSGDPIQLEPIARLTKWEQAYLAALAQNHGFTQQSFGSRSQAQLMGTGSPSGDPGASRLVLLEYRAPTGKFVMALLREKNAWKVLEPALPL